jgi:MFS transporter, YNFM family, putative membrane transport protein
LVNPVGIRRADGATMGKDPRRWAVALAGVCAYLDLYAPQSLLPMLAGVFHASTATVGLTITMTTLAVAIVAPFTGALADTLGRKAIIVPAVFLLAVPTVLIALSASLPLILLWRFVQGLFMPAIFATTVAYIGDEWDREDVPSVTALYICPARCSAAFSAGSSPGWWRSMAAGRRPSCC